MIKNRDRILALDESGALYLLKANPERFELLAERSVSTQSCWAHLAMAGRHIAVRELKAIALYEWK